MDPNYVRLVKQVNVNVNVEEEDDEVAEKT